MNEKNAAQTTGRSSSFRTGRALSYIIIAVTAIVGGSLGFFNAFPKFIQNSDPEAKIVAFERALKEYVRNCDVAEFDGRKLVGTKLEYLEALEATEESLTGENGSIAKAIKKIVLDEVKGEAPRPEDLKRLRSEWNLRPVWPWPIVVGITLGSALAGYLVGVTFIFTVCLLWNFILDRIRDIGDAARGRPS